MGTVNTHKHIYNITMSKKASKSKSKASGKDAKRSKAEKKGKSKKSKSKSKSKSKPKIVILGGTGNVGQATIGALVERYSADVVVTTRDAGSEKAEALGEMGVEVVEVDMGSSKQVAKVLKGADAAYIVTPGTENRADVVKEALKAGVVHVLVVSVTTAGKKTIFGKQFKKIEAKVISSGIPYTIVRLPLFLENELGNAGTIKAAGSVYGMPKAKFTPVSVSDVGEASAAILTKPEDHASAIYTLAGARVTQRDLVKAYSKALKKADVVEDNVEYVEVHAEGVKGAFLGFGYPEWQVDGIIELFDLVNEGSSTMNVKDKDSDLSKFVSKPVSVKDFAQNMVPAVENAPAGSGSDDSGSGSDDSGSGSGSSESGSGSSASGSGSGSGSGSDSGSEASYSGEEES